MSKERKAAVKAAAEALADLNAFAIVVTILEGGAVHAPSHEAAEKIIKICHREEQKRLSEYDSAVAKAVR